MKDDPPSVPPLQSERDKYLSQLPTNQSPIDAVIVIVSTGWKPHERHGFIFNSFKEFKYLILMLKTRYFDSHETNKDFHQLAAGLAIHCHHCEVTAVQDCGASPNEFSASISSLRRLIGIGSNCIYL